MTEILAMNSPAPSVDPAAETASHKPSPLNPLFLFTSTAAIFFHPKAVARQWTHVSLRAAILTAITNLLLSLPWIYLIITFYVCLDSIKLRRGFAGPWVDDPVRAFLDVFTSLPQEILRTFHDLDTLSRIGISLSGVLIAVSALMIFFFILLPFAARPGSSRAGIRHTARTALLATGFIHVASPLIAATLLGLIVVKTAPGPENVAPIFFFLFIGITLWLFAVSILAARQDYRSPQDMPKPRDPTCEFCGYDLRMSPPDGRCSECGELISASLGDHTRPPTPWEKSPSFLRPASVLSQLKSILFSPCKLFYSMPTRDGHRAAQHWLLGSVLLVGLIASCILPLFIPFGIFEKSKLLIGPSIAVGILWAALALMMVGIETLGLVTFGRFHKRPIELAAAAKTTSYASFLMFFWVLLGGAQLIALALWWHYGYTRTYSPRVTEAISVGSFAIAHIGGLLWYELTVYRGARAIQWANK